MSEYRGNERRTTPRRSRVDRRLELRWEPAKQDRRIGFGRREDDKLRSYFRL